MSVIAEEQYRSQNEARSVRVNALIRRVPANETPAAKMQRLMEASFRKYAQEFPAQALEIVRQEVLDKRK